MRYQYFGYYHIDLQVDITFGEKNQVLNIAMKKPLKCYGDVDTLMQLGMYKVDDQFYRQNIPNASQVLKFLSDVHINDIFINNHTNANSI